MSLVILYFSDNAETNHLSNQQHWALWIWKEYMVKSRTLLVWMKLAFPRARTAKPDIQLIIVLSAHWLQENEITCFHLVDWIIQSWDNIYFVSKTIWSFNWTKHHLWWGVHRCDLLSLIEDLIFFCSWNHVLVEELTYLLVYQLAMTYLINNDLFFSQIYKTCFHKKTGNILSLARTEKSL